MINGSARSAPIRVLVVINRIGAQGGAERSTQEIIEGLHGSGVDFSVYALWADSDGSVTERLQTAGVEVRVGPPGFLQRVRTLRRMVRELRPHVVHSVLFDADMAARAATAFTRTPMLCSLVSTQYSAEATAAARSRWKLEAVRFLDAVTGRMFVDCFHAVSEAVRDHARSRMKIPLSRIRVVQRGRDLRRLGRRSPTRRSQAREVLAISPESLVLLTLGRQEPAKDHATLVRAVAAVAKKVPDTVLLLAGSEGSSTPELLGLVQSLGLASNVRTLGVRSDVGDLLSAADVFVLSSRWEGLPGAAIEALAMGTPIVATDIPATRDVVGDNGLLVAVGDHGELARAILEVATFGDDARQRADAGMEDFRGRFSAAAMLDGMAQLYAEVARPER